MVSGSAEFSCQQPSYSLLHLPLYLGTMVCRGGSAVGASGLSRIHPPFLELCLSECCGATPAPPRTIVVLLVLLRRAVGAALLVQPLPAAGLAAFLAALFLLLGYAWLLKPTEDSDADWVQLLAFGSLRACGFRVSGKRADPMSAGCWTGSGHAASRRTPGAGCCKTRLAGLRSRQMLSQARRA